MKVLLDECVNSRLRRLILDHQVTTAVKMGWSGIQNGRLLSRAVDAGFQAFITLDKSLSYQNHVASYPIAVIVMRVRSNSIADFKPLVPELLVALENPLPERLSF